MFFGDLHRVDSDQPLRDHVKAGDLLPLNRGAGGRVLMAFGGTKGALYSRIRRDEVLVIEGDRTPELAGISARASRRRSANSASPTRKSSSA